MPRYAIDGDCVYECYSNKEMPLIISDDRKMVVYKLKGKIKDFAEEHIDLDETVNV